MTYITEHALIKVYEILEPILREETGMNQEEYYNMLE